jgi:hypothetical protein
MIPFGALNDCLLGSQRLVTDLVDKHPDLTRRNVNAKKRTASDEQASEELHGIVSVPHRKITFKTRTQKF